MAFKNGATAPSDTLSDGGLQTDKLAGFRPASGEATPAIGAGENNEPAPAPIADPANPAPDPVPVAAEPAETPAPVPAKPDLSFKDAAREAIYARARQNRPSAVDDGERLEDFMTPEQRLAMHGAFAAPEDPARQVDTGTAPAAVDAAAAPTPTVEMVELTINGEKVYRPKAEVDEMGGVRAAQMTLAAQRLLDAAKRERDETRALLEEARTGKRMPVAATNGDGAADHPDHPDASTSQPTKLDKAKIAGIREKIQVGTDEDGDLAIQQLIDYAVEVARESVPSVVADTVIRQEDDQRWNEATAKTAEAFQDLINDPDRSTVFIRRMAAEAMADFKRIGASPEDLRALEGNLPAILQNFRRLSQERRPDGQPWGLRGYDEIMGAAGKETRKAFNLADPTPAAPQNGAVRSPAEPIQINRTAREAVKAGLVTQPKASTARGGVGAAVAAQVARTPSDVVKDIRRSRGQPVH